MHYDDGAGQAPPLCMLAQGPLQAIRIEVPRFAVAVEEYGLAAEIANGIRARDKRKGGAEYLIAVPNAGPSEHVKLRVEARADEADAERGHVLWSVN